MSGLPDKLSRPQVVEAVCVVDLIETEEENEGEKEEQ
jgi:hypothetical protein